jgi:fido (protein-threonine AMPylation protein)
LSIGHNNKNTLAQLFKGFFEWFGSLRLREQVPSVRYTYILDLNVYCNYEDGRRRLPYETNLLANRKSVSAVQEQRVKITMRHYQ